MFAKRSREEFGKWADARDLAVTVRLEVVAFLEQFKHEPTLPLQGRTDFV